MENSGVHQEDSQTTVSHLKETCELIIVGDYLAILLLGNDTQTIVSWVLRSHEETCHDHLVVLLGTHFDPALVEVFQSIPLDEFRAIREEFLETTGEIIDPRIARILEPERVRQSD